MPAPAVVPAAPVTVVRVACIPMKEYSKDQQAAVAAEMASHPAPTAEDQFIVDYGQLRSENRAACKS
jgi:hypothetical protein